MSKKKYKLESPGMSIYEPCTDIFISEESEPIEASPDSIPVRGETINLLLIDECGYFDTTKEITIQPIKSKSKISSDKRRRLRLLK